MGMSGPKSLIEAKDGHSFLDVIVRQTLELRHRHGARLPLVLMDSFSTSEATLAALERYPDLEVDLPLDFLQSKEPKLRAEDLSPVDWPDDPALEWCPPGHGDLYTALVSSGMLEQMLDRGYEHAFVSNSDNLGAVLEPRIASWFARERPPFVMEAVIGTESDRKGGHLARRSSDGQLVLRESAQVPDEDEDSFSDYRRWRFYNTNTLWVSLRALAEVVDEHGGFVPLSLIANRKTVDPGDSRSPDVIQLETAMGAAVGTFEGARALVVPRARFVPVKTTDDLLVLRSDAYEMADDARIAPRDGVPFVELDSSLLQAPGRLRGALPRRPALAGAVRAARGARRRRVRPRRRGGRRRRGGGRGRGAAARRGRRGARGRVLARWALGSLAGPRLLAARHELRPDRPAQRPHDEDRRDHEQGDPHPQVHVDPLAALDVLVRGEEAEDEQDQPVDPEQAADHAAHVEEVGEALAPRRLRPRPPRPAR